MSDFVLKKKPINGLGGPKKKIVWFYFFHSKAFLNVFFQGKSFDCFFLGAENKIKQKDSNPYSDVELNSWTFQWDLTL